MCPRPWTLVPGGPPYGADWDSDPDSASGSPPRRVHTALAARQRTVAACKSAIERDLALRGPLAGEGTAGPLAVAPGAYHGNFRQGSGEGA